MKKKKRITPITIKAYEHIANERLLMNDREKWMLWYHNDFLKLNRF